MSQAPRHAVPEGHRRRRQGRRPQGPLHRLGHGATPTPARRNLRYGLDNWIYGIVGYSGFTGEVGGEPTAVPPGRSSGSSPTARSSSSCRLAPTTTRGASASARRGGVFGSTANGCPSVYMPIPNRYYESVPRAGPGRLREHRRLELASSRSPSTRPAGRLARRLHRRRPVTPSTPPAPSRSTTGTGRRSSPSRPATSSPRSPSSTRGARLRRARRLEPAGQRRRVDRARCTAEVGPDGARLGDRLVQLHRPAQPDARGLQDRQGQRLRDPAPRQDARPHLPDRLQEGRRSERSGRCPRPTRRASSPR